MTANDLSESAPAQVPPGYTATFRPATRYGFLQRTGARLRYAYWNAPGTAARGSIVLQQGRAEFIEKYALEVVGELLSRGFAVYALDWRGQGLSDRPLPDHDKGHIDDFATFVDDFQVFLDEVVTPSAPRPIVALCHSMGGHILLRHLAERGTGPFSAAACVSPMMALSRGHTIRSLVRVLSPLCRRDQSYMIGTGPYMLSRRAFATNDVTSDEWRYRFTDRWFEADPRLQLGGPTIGWVRQAFRSMDRLAEPGVLERIDLPLLVVSASADKVVDPRAHMGLAHRVTGARHVVIEGSMHEVMMESDTHRRQFWQAFDDLVKRLML